MTTTLLLRASAFAQELVAETAEITTTTAELDPLELAQKGGWIMIPLVVLSILAVYIFIERYFAIRRAAKIDGNFMSTIKIAIQSNNIDQAKIVCAQNDSPMSRMIAKGINRIGRPLNDVSKAIENVGNIEVSKLEKGLPTLASVSGGAPMIGFLGTVIGMIQAFFDMASAGSNIDVTLLSSGIYQAMVTTVAGLIVGIFAYFAYNILVTKVEKVVTNMEMATTEFMDILHTPTNSNPKE